MYLYYLNMYRFVNCKKDKTEKDAQVPVDLLTVNLKSK